MSVKGKTLKGILLSCLFIVFTALQAQVFEDRIYVKVSPMNTPVAGWSLQDPGPFAKSKERIQSLGRLSKIPDESFQRLYQIVLRPGVDGQQYLAFLLEQHWVEIAEFAPKYEFSYSPNDYSPTVQWNLAAVNATQAWDISKGDPNIRIAIVDDAVLTTHEDLKNQIWKNTKETAGNGIDDDGNGYIDDIMGWDAADYDNDPNPPGTASSSYFSHGTHCAGIAGASTDNSVGIASLAFNITLMPVKIAQNSTYMLTGAYEGVEYAIINNAHVISMSWGGGAFSAVHQMLFDLAYKKGIVCVAAAGNSAVSTPMYPAAYNHVISVASTQSGDKLSSFTNYGTTIDVCAPGSAIYSTVPGTGKYDKKSGTSMACPLVSSLCGLMLSRNPLLKPDDLEKCLKASCDNIDAQNPTFKGKMGAGRINAYKSLQCVKLLTARAWWNKRIICNNQSINYYDSSGSKVVSRKWIFQGGSPSTSTVINPTVSYANQGDYNVMLIVFDGTNYDTLNLLSHVEVINPTVRFSGNRTVPTGARTFFTAKFTGTGPWDLIYTDGSKQDTIKNIQTDVYDVVVDIFNATKFWPLKVSDINCNGTLFDTAYFSVISDCTFGTSFSMNLGSNVSDQVAGAVYIDKDKFLVAGVTDSLGNTEIYAHIMDNNGKILKGMVYKNSKTELLYTVRKCNKGFLLVGSQYAGPLGAQDALLIKLDDSLNIKWSKVYGGNDVDFFLDAKEVGNVIIANGSTQSQTYGAEDGFILKLDTANGAIKWSRNFGDGAYNRAMAVDVLPSGNIIIGSQILVGNFNCVMVKLGSNGSMITSKQIVFNYNSDAAAVKYYGGSMYVAHRIRIAGSGDLDVMLTKLDTSLSSIAWSRRIYTSMNEYLNELIIDSVGNIIVSGTTQNGVGGGFNQFLVKYSTNGTLLGSADFGGSKDDWISGVIALSNEQYLVTGWSNSTPFKTGDANNGFLNRVNCNLSACNSNKDNLLKSTVTYNYSANTFSIQSGGTSANATFTASKMILRTKFGCKQTVKPKQKCRLDADFSVEERCTGDTFYFKDKSVDTMGATIRNWRWYFANKDSIIGVQNPGKVLNQSGNHLVKLVVFSGDTMICSDTVSKWVRVVDSFRIAGSPSSTTCFFDSAQLGVSTYTCGAAPFQYLWSPVLGMNDPRIASPKVLSRASTKYKVVVTDKNGKIDSAVVTVIVDSSCCKSYPIISVNKPSICIGDSFTLKNTSVVTSGATFKWRFSPDAIGSTYTGTTPLPKKFKGPGPKTVTMILTDACGVDSVKLDLYVNPLPIANAGQDSGVCIPDSVQLGDVSLGNLDYSWSPTTGLTDPKAPDPKAWVTAGIKYTLTVTDPMTGCKNKDSIQIFAETKMSLKLGNDTSICMGDTLQLLAKSYKKFTWNTGDTSALIRVSKSGTYWVHGTTNSCFNDDTINIAVFKMPISLGKDTSFCQGDSATITSNGFQNYLWSTGATGNSISVKSGGSYWVKGNSGNCYNYDTIQVNVDPSPVFSLGVDLSICKGTTAILNPIPNYSGASYNWSTGENTQQITVNKAGNYILRMQLGKCFWRDSLLVNIVTKPALQGFNDTFICDHMPMYISMLPQSGVSYTWSDGLNGSSLYVPRAGSYWLKASNVCGDTTVNFNVRDSSCHCNLWLPNAFTPNDDNRNDIFNLRSSCPLMEYNMRIYNRWGQKLFESFDFNKGWDGRYMNKAVMDGSYVFIVEVKFNYNGLPTLRQLNGVVDVMR